MAKTHGHRDVIAVINLKGGTSKTTTAVYLAHALHEQGRRVLLVDADPQASALNWSEDAEQPFPFSVVGMASRELHRQLPDVMSNFDAVVIDTPPLDQKTGIVLSAIRLATLVVAPTAPNPMEYKRLMAVRETVADASSFRADGEPTPMAVLLTRSVGNAASTKVYRDQITADGMWCLKTDIRRREQFAQAYGENITHVSRTAYGDALLELMGHGMSS